MKPRRQRHLRLVDDSDTGDVHADPETDLHGVEILLTDTSGFDWTDAGDDAVALRERLKQLAAAVAVDEGVETGMLHLYLVAPGFMGYLNKTFMGHDGPTDVLAFPIDGPEVVGAGVVDLSLVPDPGVDIEDIGGVVEPEGADGAVEGVEEPEVAGVVGPDIDEDHADWDDNDYDSVPIHLGDVMVCPQVAARQAPDHTGSFRAELSLLVIHGVLHVLGHDHAEPAEAARMRSRERRHLDRLGHRHPVDR